MQRCLLEDPADRTQRAGRLRVAAYLAGLGASGCIGSLADGFVQPG